MYWSSVSTHSRCISPVGKTDKYVHWLMSLYTPRNVNRYSWCMYRVSRFDCQQVKLYFYMFRSTSCIVPVIPLAYYSSVTYACIYFTSVISVNIVSLKELHLVWYNHWHTVSPTVKPTSHQRGQQQIKIFQQLKPLNRMSNRFECYVFSYTVGFILMSKHQWPISLSSPHSLHLKRNSTPWTDKLGL